MMLNVRRELGYIVRDWYRYMDTTVPCGVNRKLFTHLKYTNKDKIMRLLDDHPEIDYMLLEKVAIKEYLEHSEEEILQSLKPYLEEEVKI